MENLQKNSKNGLNFDDIVKKQPERRTKMMQFMPADLSYLFEILATAQTANYRLQGLPKDFRVAEIVPDQMTGSIFVFIESPEFPIWDRKKAPERIDCKIGIAPIQTI